MVSALLGKQRRTVMKSKEGNEEKEGLSLLRMNAYRAKRQK